jgi:hypothetical protein
VNAAGSRGKGLQDLQEANRELPRSNSLVTQQPRSARQTAPQGSWDRAKFAGFPPSVQARSCRVCALRGRAHPATDSYPWHRTRFDPGRDDVSGGERFQSTARRLLGFRFRCAVVCLVGRLWLCEARSWRYSCSNVYTVGFVMY